MIEIEIETSDKSLFTDLTEEKIPELQLAVEMRICNSIDWVPPLTGTIKIIINTSSYVALSLFSVWLYDRIKKKKPKKTTINNTNIVNNPEKIIMIINNYIQIIQNDQKNNK
jgi:hypothetical protein